MKVWSSIHGADHVPAGTSTVVTIGNFDGVHLGHRHVLARARGLAASLGRVTPLPVVAVTFDPHPLRVLAPTKAPSSLCSLDRRVRLLREHGADVVCVLAFDREMAGWSPEDFVKRVLVGELNAAAIVVGENFRFGAKAAGDMSLLRRAGDAHGFVVDGLKLDGDVQPWSSTYVRSLIDEGDVAEAAHVLGRHHSLEGVVVEGHKRGRQMGYPTANMPASEDEAVPADGVYAGYLRRRDDGSVPLPAAISVGTNPTFDGAERVVESYVLDRTDLELYGAPVEVTFVARIRGQVKFTGTDDLMVQMAADVDETRRILADGQSDR